MPDVIDSATDTTKEVAPAQPHPSSEERKGNRERGLPAWKSSIEALKRCQSTSKHNPWVTYNAERTLKAD